MFHIVLNWVGLCVIVVTCNGKTTFLFYRYNRLTLLRYISRVKPTSSLSCFVTASIRWAHTIASLHFDRVMDAVYCSFSLQWMKTAWTSTVFRMTNIPLRPQDTRWCSAYALRDCLHITHLHRFFSNKASYQCSHFQNKSCEIVISWTCFISYGRIKDEKSSWAFLTSISKESIDIWNTFQNPTAYCSSVLKSSYPLYKIPDQLDFAFNLYSMQPLLVNCYNFTILQLHKSLKNITEA